MEQYIFNSAPPPNIKKPAAAAKRAKRKKHFADYIVAVSITAVMLYTVTAFILQFVLQIEVSSTLTTCYFSFFGIELVNLALIKRGKTKARQSEITDNIFNGSEVYGYGNSYTGNGHGG